MLLKKLAVALSLSIACLGTASAQSPAIIAQFKAWGAYSYDSEKGKICYILSLPTNSAPTSVNHGDIFFLVSQRPGETASYEPQAKMGYALKEGSKVNVNVDGTNYVLFTQGDSAWVEDKEKLPVLVEAMRAGTSMTVKATSWRGTKTTYTYSLSGVTAALKEIGNCR